MELRQLRYFTALAEELNFTRAAERLHISQPPLSAQIAQLEDEMGVKLFRRSSRRVELTPAGNAFLRDVRTVHSRLKEAIQRAQGIHAGLEGRIELGLSGSHFLGPLPARIAQLAHSHPDIRVVLNELEPNDQLEALREQRIDLSISRQAMDDGLLISVPLWTDPLLVALPQAHPLASHQRLTLQDLAQETFVMLKRESSTFAQRIFQACAAQGFAPRVGQTVAQVPAQLGLVEAGLGIALVPASARSCRYRGVSFCVLVEKDLEGGVHAVYRNDNDKAALHTFLEHLRSGSIESDRR